MVWAVFTHDIFCVDEYNKLWERKIEPCTIMLKINDNVYQLRLPSYLKTSYMFHVKHLTPCFVNADKDNLNSRMSSFQLGETDAGEEH